MGWWQISNTPLYQQSQTKPQWRRVQLRLGRKTKQNKKKKETWPGSEVSISCPCLFACHLLDMIITTKQGRRGLSWPHLYQQAGIKLSNYPPRSPARPPTLLAELVPFASLARSQTLQAGMWKHILMTALFQSQVFVIALSSLYTLCGTSPTK